MGLSANFLAYLERNRQANARAVSENNTKTQDWGRVWQGLKDLEYGKKGFAGQLLTSPVGGIIRLVSNAEDAIKTSREGRTNKEELEKLGIEANKRKYDLLKTGRYAEAEAIDREIEQRAQPYREGVNKSVESLKSLQKKVPGSATLAVIDVLGAGVARKAGQEVVEQSILKFGPRMLQHMGQGAKIGAVAAPAYTLSEGGSAKEAIASIPAGAVGGAALSGAFSAAGTGIKKLAKGIKVFKGQLLKGNASFLDENGDLKFEMGAVSGLHDKATRKTYDFIGAINTKIKDKTKPMNLTDIFDSPKVYENNPYLTKTRILISDLGEKTMGEYSDRRNQITLNSRLFDLGHRGKKMMNTLVHEIVHNVQNFENMSPGANFSSANKAAKEKILDLIDIVRSSDIPGKYKKIAQLTDAYKNEGDEAMESAYLAVAGEIEARGYGNTVTRNLFKKMPTNDPLSREGIAAKDMLVLGRNGGVASSSTGGSIDNAVDGASQFVKDVLGRSTNSQEIKNIFGQDDFKAAISEMSNTHGYEKTVRWVQKQYNDIAKSELADRIASIEGNPLFEAIKDKRIQAYINRNGELPEHFGRKGSKSSLDEMADSYGMDAESFRNSVEKLYREYRAAKSGFADNVEDLMGIRQDMPETVPTPAKAEENHFTLNEDIYGSSPYKYTDLINEAESRYGGDVAAAMRSTWGINPPSANDANLAAIEMIANAPSARRKGYKIEAWDVKSAANVLSELGSFGGNLSLKGKFGADADRSLVEVTLPLRERAKKLIRKTVKTDVGRMDLEKRVFDALEDRANAAGYFNNESEFQVYKTYEQFFDFWKKQMQEKGVPVRDDYVTHIGEMINRLDEVTKTGDLPEELSSRFKEARSLVDQYSGTKEISRIADIYDSVMRKDFSYGDLLSYYNENIKNIPPHLMQREDFGSIKKYMGRWMQTLLSPDTTTKEHRAAAKFLAHVYNNALWNNFKLSAQNHTQRWLSDAFVSNEARQLRKLLSPEMKHEMVNYIRPFESSTFNEVPVNSEVANKLMASLKKSDTYRWSEKSNWDYSGLNGMMEEIAQSKMYKDLVAGGMSKGEAAVTAIRKDAGLVQKAFVRGVNLMEITQIGANRASQPAFWRSKETILGLPKPIFLMFKRYNIGMFEIYYKTLVRPQAMREMMIYRRGLPDQSFIVDSIRKGELQLQQANDIIRAVKSGEATQYKVEDAITYKNIVENNLKIMRDATKSIETVNRAKLAKSLAKIWAAGTVINLVDSSIRSALGTTNPDNADLGSAAYYALPGAQNPNPERLFIPALTPSTNVRRNVKLAYNLTPYLGAADRLTGGLLSEGTAQMFGARPYNQSRETKYAPASSGRRPAPRSK